MRVSNPTYTRESGSAHRYHIFDATGGYGERYMRCGHVYNPQRALEMRFDLEPEAIRTQVCGVCKRSKVNLNV